MGESMHVEATGLTSMGDLSEEQRQMVDRCVKQVADTAEKTQLSGDARVALNQSIPKIIPVLEEFIHAIDTTIQNYDEANKGLSATVNSMENNKAV